MAKMVGTYLSSIHSRLQSPSENKKQSIDDLVDCNILEIE